MFDTIARGGEELEATAHLTNEKSLDNTNKN